MKHPHLHISGVSKRYESNTVLNDVSIDIRKGEFFFLLGPSGCGKTTLLRILAGLLEPDAGTITLDEANITHTKPHLRDVKTVFQHYALFPHMTVLENVIEAPVHVLGVPKREAVERAEALLDKVGIVEKRNEYPAHLSGGQQQRCAIARALAMEPQVMLFDEPTSALDPELVGEVLRVMRDLAEEGRTMIIVTHEMRFAREVSSEIVFLHQGRIEEQGPPSQVFGAPRSERCRQFLATSAHEVVG